MWGDGDNFTAYFVETTEYDGNAWSVSSTIVSGTVASDGIKNLEYAIILMTKQDPNGGLMQANEYRIFCDKDGLSNYVNWTNK